MDWKIILQLFIEIVFLPVVVYVIQRNYNKKCEFREKAALDRATARRDESLLSLNINRANSELSYALVAAVKRGVPNGEVEKSITAYKAACKEYEDFILRNGIKSIIE